MAKSITSTAPKTTPPKEGNPFVAITAILAVFYAGIVALVVIFSADNAFILAPIAFAFVLLGWVMAYYASKAG